MLIDYCVLPSEIHVVCLLTGSDGPADVARAIGNVLARWVREVSLVKSPVLGGPFQASRLYSDDEIRQEARRLAWRPVVQGECRGPSYYADGALRVALGMRPPEGYDSRPLLSLFGVGVNEGRAGLRRFLWRRPPDHEWHAWELARGLALAPSKVGPNPAGSRQIKSGDAASLIAMAGEGVDDALGLLSAWVTKRLGGPDQVDLREGRDEVAVRGRAIVGRLARTHALCSSASVARFFGRAKATISEQMTASRSRPADNEMVSTPVVTIVSETLSRRRASSPEAR